MTFLNILNLVIFILMINTKAKLIHKNSELNGENLVDYVFVRHLFKSILIFPRGFRK